MSNQIVPGVYTSVIKDVIENVKKDFVDSGIDETVLYELERNWFQKLKGFKVAPWNQNDGIVGDESNGSTTNVRIQPVVTTELTNVPSKYPSNEFDTPAANLPTLATSTINSDTTSNGMNKHHSYMHSFKNVNSNPTQNGNRISGVDQKPPLSTRIQQQQDADLYNNSHINNNHNNSNSSSSNNNNNHNHHNNNYSHNNINDDNNSNSLVQSHTQFSSSIQQQPLPPPPQQQQPMIHPDTYEKKSEDIIATRNLYVDEDDINSDLDDSDEDEGAAEGEFQNIILCLYDKVTRTKNKWKCQLKDGIMLVNGKEYLFQKGNGDFEF